MRVRYTELQKNRDGAPGIRPAAHSNDASLEHHVPDHDGDHNRAADDDATVYQTRARTPSVQPNAAYLLVVAANQKIAPTPNNLKPEKMCVKEGTRLRISPAMRSEQTSCMPDTCSSSQAVTTRSQQASASA